MYNLLEVKIESMFDNGKGRIQRTDIFLVRVGMRGEFGGARRRASKSGSVNRKGDELVLSRRRNLTA